MLRIKFAALTCLLIILGSSPLWAASDQEVELLRAEIAAMKAAHEERILLLEAKLEEVAVVKVAAKSEATSDEIIAVAPIRPATNRRQIKNNLFNPSIGLIFNGQYTQHQTAEGEIAGFAVGHEGERGGEGFAIDHTELTFSSTIDDKFFGSLTAAIVKHEGKTEIELEEAFIQTMPGLGLPTGASIKAGRFLATIGYLNEHHTHTDDFTDRPLPYRVFLDGGYNDDGLQATYVLPTDFYAEIGGGLFRGDDYPFGGSDGEGIDAWTAYARTGGDIGENQSWRLGGSVLSGKSTTGRESNHELVSYVGDTDLYIADARYTWAPTGNATNQEFALQGEFFWKEEDGFYSDAESGADSVLMDDSSEGWYTQATYKFARNWRFGARYSQLNAADVPTGLIGSHLDGEGYNPKAYTAMFDWTNSEFSRVRLQYNREELASGQGDDQIMLQYIMSIGAHAAHKY
ncbi:MAG: TonB-dependent receptor [Gammaproteobacteria bacterium]|jgi:hypothetical protein